MVIEFRCPHCSKSLKTSDEKAGKRAKCPGCGEVVTVPAGTFDSLFVAAPATSDPDAPDQESSDEYEFEEPVAGQPGPLPPSESTKPCPMCGATILAGATRCRFCGENLRPGGELGKVVPTRIAAMDVLNHTWGLYKDNLGICLGVALVLMGTNFITGFIQNLVAGLGQAAVGRDPAAQALVPLILIGIVVANQLFSLFLTLGANKAMLKIGKGGAAEISEVFSAGRFFLRGIGVMILMGLIGFAAAAVFMIPTIGLTLIIKDGDARGPVLALGVFCAVLALMFILLRLSPAMYCLIDQDCGPVQALTLAWSVTQGNMLQLIVMGLATVLAMVAGVIACCVGIIAVIPYAMLMQAVSYLMMSGQIASASAARS